MADRFFYNARKHENTIIEWSTLSIKMDLTATSCETTPINTQGKI
jgi:hypothetical protein